MARDARPADFHLRPRPSAVRPGIAGRLAAPRGRRSSGASISSKEKLADATIRRGRSRRAFTCRCTPRRGWRRRSSGRSGRSIRRRGSARTGCTRRSTQTGCGRSASTMCSAGNSRRIWPPLRRGAADEPAAPTSDAAARVADGLRQCPSCISSSPDRSRAAAAGPVCDASCSVTARRRVAGYTEASRGCQHLCRHCPVVPIYDGQFRIVQPDVVLADIAAQVAAGAEHITFGDPDFFNGPTHAMRIVEATARRASVAHLRRHDQGRAPAAASRPAAATARHRLSVRDERGRVARRPRAGACSRKGTRAADFVAAVDRCREAGLTLVPTFVAFHPWMTLDGYCDLLDTIARAGSRRSRRADSARYPAADPRGVHGCSNSTKSGRLVGAFRSRRRSRFRGRIPIPRVDALQHERRAPSSACGSPSIAGRCSTASARWRTSAPASPRPAARRSRAVETAVPYLDEPWYCCAEPNPEQLTLV